MTRRIVLMAAAVFLLLAGALAARLDVPRMTNGHTGDEGTFVTMALSLAHDGDLKYSREDYVRWVALYNEGPHGIFLKRGPGSTEDALDFGKAHTFAVFAAPFVGLMGLGGIWFMNALLLGMSIACTVAFARARCGPVAGWVLGAGFWIASVVPSYVVWLTPEVLNVALVTAGLFLWLYKEVAPATSWAGWRHEWTDLAAALLIGIATFTKPPNAVFFAPMVGLYLWRRQGRTLLLAAALFAVGSVGNFGLNAWNSGEWNYQGGAERKSFYFQFPFDGTGYTFDSLQHVMTTDASVAETYGNVERLREMLPPNIRYFFFGQYAGLVPWFFPGALLLAWFVVRVRDWTVWQWLLVCATLGGALVLMVATPTSWSGGGGPLGNRYFLSLYPGLFFLLPASVGRIGSLAAVLGGLLCVWPALLSPLALSRDPSTAGDHWPVRELVRELTLIDDAPPRTNRSRGRIEHHFDSFVLFYYTDPFAYSPEPRGHIPGNLTDAFWIAGGRTARVIVRSATPLTEVTFTVSSRVPNAFRVDLQGRSGRVALHPEQEAVIRLVPGRPVRLLASYAYLMTLSAAEGFVPASTEADSADTRNLGVFVRPVFQAPPYAAPSTR